MAAQFAFEVEIGSQAQALVLHFALAFQRPRQGARQFCNPIRRVERRQIQRRVPGNAVSKLHVHVSFGFALPGLHFQLRQRDLFKAAAKRTAQAECARRAIQRSGEITDVLTVGVRHFAIESTQGDLRLVDFVIEPMPREVLPIDVGLSRDAFAPVDAASTCVFVDHGLLRKDEGDEVEGVFGPNGQFDLNFIRVNAQQRYYDKLAGVTEPEAKRKIIGEEFIRIFEEEAKKIGAVDFLAQGTIYPDVVESGLGGESAVIKSHHNVGGLPDFVDFKEIIEPLRDLFKDEVRKAGLELGIPERLVFRQPFPGPGLGIRIIGEVTAEKVRIVQDADFIYREEVDNAAAEYKKEHGEDPSWMPNQYFAALTNMRSVGVMGDFRTYDYAVALRAVKTIDFMTAESAEIPYAVLNKVMNRIINEVKGVNRVFYDLTSKPPGTIEFE